MIDMDAVKSMFGISAAIGIATAMVLKSGAAGALTGYVFFLFVINIKETK